jgi:hypothetical protein
MRAASTARPEKEIAEAMRLTPAREHSYPCVVKSNLKLGHPAGSWEKPL